MPCTRDGRSRSLPFSRAAGSDYRKGGRMTHRGGNLCCRCQWRLASRPAASCPRNAYARLAPSGCMNGIARTSR